MSPEPTVILHGWSDSAGSFRKLSQEVRRISGNEPIVIKLANWVSMQNDVTFDDLAEAMQRAWIAEKLPVEPRSANVIVHSTGSLVVRHWLTRHFAPGKSPIKRFVMLAPANFGSPLAHKGRSWIGRALKGWDEPGFQTGTQILKGLELASPYTWNLASRDLFDGDARWYGAGAMLATVIVGDTGYSGVQAIANEDGGDGTVRISTANLNTARVTLRLDSEQRVASAEHRHGAGPIAFAIAHGENHSTVAFKDGGPRSRLTNELLAGALRVQDEAFRVKPDATFAWQDRIDTVSRGQSSGRFANLVVRLRDQFGNDIPDYFIEFYRKTGTDKAFEKTLYEEFIRKVHTYEDNPAYRSMYVDLDALERMTRDNKVPRLFLSVLAHPIFKPAAAKVQPVGFNPMPPNREVGLQISAEDFPKYFAPHRTLFVDLTLEKVIHESVFRFEN